MKTAISMPEETFARATRQASARGMSRSQFITEAVQAYLERLEADSLTRAIDEAIEILEHDDSGRAAVSAGRKRLAQDESSW